MSCVLGLSPHRCLPSKESIPKFPKQFKTRLQQNIYREVCMLMLYAYTNARLFTLMSCSVVSSRSTSSRLDFWCLLTNWNKLWVALKIRSMIFMNVEHEALVIRILIISLITHLEFNFGTQALHFNSSKQQSFFGGCVLDMCPFGFPFHCFALSFVQPCLKSC